MSPVRDASGKEPPRFWLARLNSLPIRGKQAAQGKRAQGGEKGACAAGAGGPEQSGNPQEALNQGYPIDPPGGRGIHEFRGDQPPDSIDKHADTTPSRTGIRGGLIHPQSIMRSSLQWPKEKEKKEAAWARTDGEDAGEQRAEHPAGGPGGGGGVPGARPPQRVEGAAGSAGGGGPGRGGRRHRIHYHGQARSIRSMLRIGSGSRAHIYSSSSGSPRGRRGRGRG